MNDNRKTRKVMDINVEGESFICIYAGNAPVNKYRLYRRWFENGKWHRKKIEYYGNFVSVLCHLKEYAFSHNWGFKDF